MRNRFEQSVLKKILMDIEVSQDCDLHEIAELIDVPYDVLNYATIGECTLRGDTKRKIMALYRISKRSADQM